MAVDEYGGHGDPQRGDGDPESIRAFADWLESQVAKAVDDAAGMVNGAMLVSMSGFIGLPGDGFRERMSSGIGHAYDFAAATRRSAKALFDAATALQEAQVEVDLAWEIAHDPENHLEVVKGEVQQPPALPPIGLHRVPVMERTREERVRAHEAFEWVQQGVNAARARIAGEKGTLKSASNLGQTLFFVSGDLVKGTAHELAENLSYKSFRVALRHADNMVALESQRKWSRLMSGDNLDEIMDRAKQEQLIERRNALDKFYAWGVVSKVAQWGGRGLVVTGIVVDYLNGDPAPKIFAKTAGGAIGGAAGGALAGALVGAATGPFVVGFIALSAALGAFGGSSIGDEIYEAVIDDMGPVPIDHTWFIEKELL